MTQRRVWDRDHGEEQWQKNSKNGGDDDAVCKRRITVPSSLKGSLDECERQKFIKFVLDECMN